MALNVFNAMGIDQDTQKMLFSTIKKTPAMKKLKLQNVGSPKAVTALENIEIDIRLFRTDQTRQKAALTIQSAFRGFSQQKKYKKALEEYNPTKIQAFHDICSKEKDFVMSIATLVSQYIVPMRTSTDRHIKKVYSEMSNTFTSIEKLMEVHQTLLKTLYELPRNSWPELHGLGDVFSYVSPHWKIYGNYVHHVYFAMRSMEENRENNEHFRDFCEKKEETTADLTLLLTRPLNHISGYTSYLKNILDLTPEDLPEHHSLLQAISITTETSKFIGNSMDQAVNLAKISTLRSQVVSTPEVDSLFDDLQQNQTSFISETELEFTEQGSKKVKQGILTLFENSCFATGKSKSQKGRTIKRIYDLKSLTIERVSSTSFSLFEVDEEKSSYNCVIESMFLYHNFI